MRGKSQNGAADGQSSRLDFAPTARKTSHVSDDGPVIEHFRERASGKTHERRKSPRYEAGMHRVWLGWWETDERFITTPARLANISLGGVLLYPDRPPHQDRPCWVCLGLPEPVDSVEVAVLEVVTTIQGQFAVRLKFREPCPYSFFKAVVDGENASARGESAPSEQASPDEEPGNPAETEWDRPRSL